MCLAAEQITITHKYHKPDITPTASTLRVRLPCKHAQLANASFSDKIRSQVLVSARPSMLISSSLTTAPGKQTQAPEPCLQMIDGTHFLLRADWLISLTSEETSLSQQVSYFEAETNSRFDTFQFPLYFVWLHYFNVLLLL